MSKTPKNQNASSKNRRKQTQAPVTGAESTATPRAKNVSRRAGAQPHTGEVSTPSGDIAQEEPSTVETGRIEQFNIADMTAAVDSSVAHRKKRRPRLRCEERLSRIGQATNKGALRGVWKPAKRYVGRFGTMLEEVAAVWDHYNGGRGSKQLWLTAYCDLGDRDAIRPTTLLTPDGSSIHLEVQQADGTRLAPLEEQQSLAPLWRHLSPSPDRQLLREYVSRSTEADELNARQSELERLYAGTDVPIDSCTSERIQIEESLRNIRNDMLAIEFRLTESQPICRCAVCRA